MGFKIEKGVPLPNGSRYNCSRFPFDRMEINDSFSFDRSDENSVRGSAKQYGKKHGKKFLIRKVSPEQCRCWRIESDKEI